MEHRAPLWEPRMEPQSISPEHATHFVHEPLDWNEAQIRLITIIPAEDGPIRCTVRHVDLNGNRTPDYRALSYTWGSSGSMQHIWLNNQIFAVRLNLFKFLEAFRAQLFNNRGSGEHKADVQWLWVDQICVNQSVLLERNHQVQMMADIYKRALYVYVWLGEADESLEKVMRALKRSYRGHHKDAKELQLSTAMRQLHFNEDDKLDRLSAYSLRRFFGNPYWTRLWIIQEVMLAKYIRIMCGDTVLTWDVLQRFCQSRLKTLSTDAVQAVPVQVAWLAEHAFSGRSYSYADMLWTFCLNECHEPRDKVYGLQGLVNVADKMPIDYARPVHEVFLHLAEAMIEGDEYLRPANLGEGLEGIDYRRSALSIFEAAASILQPEIRDRMRLRLTETLTRLGDQMGLAISDMKHARDIAFLEDRISEIWTELVEDYSSMSEDAAGPLRLKGKEFIHLKAQTQKLSGYYESLTGAARSLLLAILNGNPGGNSLVKKISFDTNTLLPSYEHNILSALDHVQRSTSQRAQRLESKDCQINITVSSGWIIKRVIPFLDVTGSLNRTGLVLDYTSQKKPARVELELRPRSNITQVVKLETIFKEQNDSDDEYTLFLAVHFKNIDSSLVSVRERWELYFDCHVGSTRLMKDTLRLTSQVFSIDKPDVANGVVIRDGPVSILQSFMMFSEEYWAYVETHRQLLEQDTGTNNHTRKETMGLWRWGASGRLQKRPVAKLRPRFVPTGFCGI